MKYTRIAKLVERIQRRRAKRGQAGFTLLELLVVVAILAAIAGTATIALQDTDARASAAAHVAMMDELNKGIGTFRVLNRNVLPTNWDSLLQTASPPAQNAADYNTAVSSPEFLDTFAADAGDFTIIGLNDNVAGGLFGAGITNLRYVGKSTSYTPEDDANKNCGDLEALILARTNAVVPGNIFLSPEANGCGFGYAFPETDGDFSATLYSDNDASALFWVGNYERILGSSGRLTGSGNLPVDTPLMMVVGIGPSSDLFENGTIGSLTSVPVYRHVSGADYNRFFALFHVGTVRTADGAVSDGGIGTWPGAANWSTADQVNLVTVIDGAGDTKEEELGEWDGTRNTI